MSNDREDGLNHASLALLTWKSPLTLAKTLKSLEIIAPEFGDSLIICQEADPSEVLLAKQYGYRVIPTSHNLGILGGLKKAVLEAQYESVLLLENDAVFMGNESHINSLSDIAGHLNNDTFQYCCLRDGRSDLSSRYKKYWTEHWPPKKKLMSHIRPLNAMHVIGESLFLSPEGETDCDFATLVSPKLWKTDSRYYRWNNRAKFLKNSFFIDQLISFAEANPTDRRVNGFPDLEHQINFARQRLWYHRQKFPLAVYTEGLFSHKRYDRPDGDEKEDALAS